MNFEYFVGRMQDVEVESLVLFVPTFTRVTDKSLKDLDTASSGAVSTLLESEEFTGKEGETVSVMHPLGFKAKRVILVGLGERRKRDQDTVRRAAGVVSRYNGLTRSQTAAFRLPGITDKSYYQAAVEGYLLGSYRLLDFKGADKDKEPAKLVQIIFLPKDRGHLRSVRMAVERGAVVAEGQLLARRLAATPANYLTPRLLAQEARQLARRHGFECQVLDEKAIAREKMGGLLGVAKGSAEPPRFIILKYNGGRAGQKPVVLLGKGVTFDTGGISLKEALNMYEMKGDMSGAAAVLATVVSAARLKTKLNIVGLMPTTENMPSGSATKPGDILNMRKGLTVEVINTDAEGRLILADGLDYANTFKPQAVVDIATLTGAALYVLGYAGAPVLGNNRRLLERVKQASGVTGEKVWEMPIWDDHREMMKSAIADLVNSGGKSAGTIAASAFLENFIGDWPWVHIDIAYVDVEHKGKPYMPRGATGFGVRLLVELLSSWKNLG